MEMVLKEFENYLRVERGRKESSISRTMSRLRAWHDPDLPVDEVTTEHLAKIYKRRSARLAAGGHQNELKEVKSFWRWMQRPIADPIEPVGRRNRGKLQLRMSETRRLYDTAFALADQGDDGAIAVLTVLLLGTRAGEVVNRKVRDVDVTDDMVLFWIEEGKTESSTRHLVVAEPLASLLASKVEGRNSDEWLFPASSGHRSIWWLRDAVHRLCRKAGVPVVTTQGLRGTHATLTTEAGATSATIAKALGHAGDAVTKQHYIEPGASQKARAKRMLKVVGGCR